MMNEAAVAVTGGVAEVDDLDDQVVTQDGETRAQLQAAFDAVCDPGDWKKPWTAKVHHCYVGRVIRAVEFFHADTAAIGAIDQTTGIVKMQGNGYQAW